MLRFALLCVTFSIVRPLSAQYVIGATAGLHRLDLRGRPSEGHASARFYNIARPDVNFGLFYRERCGAHTNLGLDLTWMRNEFDASLYEGSLAGGTQTTAHVVLHTINLAVLPEVRLSARYSAVVRFGMAVGVRVAGTMSGTRYEQWPYNWQVVTLNDAIPDVFGGELRALFGFGFQVPVGARNMITIDPYLARGSLMLKRDPGSISNEVGLRLGWVLRMKGKGLTRWLSEHVPTPPDGPNWP
jgi:hypothetical protein